MLHVRIVLYIEVVVTFVAVEYTVMEDDGSVILELQRVGSIPVTVTITTSDGTAVGEIMEIHSSISPTSTLIFQLTSVNNT